MAELLLHFTWWNDGTCAAAQQHPREFLTANWSLADKFPCRCSICSSPCCACVMLKSFLAQTALSSAGATSVRHKLTSKHVKTLFVSERLCMFFFCGFFCLLMLVYFGGRGYLVCITVTYAYHRIYSIFISRIRITIRIPLVIPSRSCSLLRQQLLFKCQKTQSGIEKNIKIKYKKYKHCKKAKMCSVHRFRAM